MEDEERNNEDPYKNCCLYEKTSCKAFKSGRDIFEGLEDITKLTECSVHGYLSNNLHFKDTLQLVKWNERLLIENRIGRVLNSSDKVCQYH